MKRVVIVVETDLRPDEIDGVKLLHFRQTSDGDIVGTDEIAVELVSVRKRGR